MLRGFLFAASSGNKSFPWAISLCVSALLHRCSILQPRFLESQTGISTRQKYIDAAMAAPSRTKSLVELAEGILKNAKALEQHLSSPPTFQHDTIRYLAAEHDHLRKSLIDASNEINALVRGAGGPHGRIFDMSYSVSTPFL